MLKQMAFNQLPHGAKKQDWIKLLSLLQTLKQNGKNQKIYPAKICKKPIYKLFFDFNGKYFPLRCMLDPGYTSFIISPEAATVFKVRVVKGTTKVMSGDISGQEIITEGIYTKHRRITVANHRMYNLKDTSYRVIKTSPDYDDSMPAQFLEEQNPCVVTTRQ